MSVWSEDIWISYDLKEKFKQNSYQLMNPWDITEKKRKKKKGGGAWGIIIAQYLELLVLFLFWSGYWRVSWKFNFKGMYSSRYISGELVVGISTLSCYWTRTHCSFAACPAEALGRAQHCLCHWWEMWAHTSSHQPKDRGRTLAQKQHPPLPQTAGKVLEPVLDFKALLLPTQNLLYVCVLSTNLIFPLSLFSQPITQVWIFSSFQTGSWEPELLQIASHCKWEGTTC